VQIALMLVAVLYLASLWIFPQLNPAFGLLLVIGLAAVGGTYVFVVSAAQSPFVPSSLTEPDAQLAPQPGFSMPEDPLPQGPRERLAWLRTARRAARRSGDLKAEGAYLAELGTALRHFGEPRRAIVYYQQALAIARQTGDQHSQSTALGNIGLAYADLGNARQAVEYYERHLLLVRASGDRASEARASWNMGLAYEELDDLARAIAAMQVCLDFERAIGHPDAEQDAAQID
jgi:tetratricopeptide (TPR) repeat protein